MPLTQERSQPALLIIQVRPAIRCLGQPLKIRAVPPIKIHTMVPGFLQRMAVTDEITHIAKETTALVLYDGQSKLITPYGGQPVNLMVSEGEAAELKARANSLPSYRFQNARLVTWSYWQLVHFPRSTDLCPRRIINEFWTKCARPAVTFSQYH